MGILNGFWHKICEPLDGFLWRRNITHHLVRPVLRNQILAAGGCLLLGTMIYAAFPWLFWFGMGILAMTWIFWSWARFTLGANLGEYSTAMLRAILLRFLARLFIFAALLYAALAWAKAPGTAIIAGITAGAFLAIISYAYNVIILGRQ